MKWEHQQDFNHWSYTTSGANFDRETYGNMVSDLILAVGNLFTENPASPYAPPGVDVERMRHPPADFCTNPVRVKQLYNAEYNPQGKYDAITFCDGEPTLYYCGTTKEKFDFGSEPANSITPLRHDQGVPSANQFCWCG